MYSCVPRRTVVGHAQKPKSVCMHNSLIISIYLNVVLIAFQVDGVPTLAIKLFSLLLELHKEEATSNTGTDGQVRCRKPQWWTPWA